MQKRGFLSIPVLAATLALGACEDPNCFVPGECASGPMAPATGFTPGPAEKAFFFEIVLFDEAEPGDPRPLVRWADEPITIGFASGASVTDRNEVGQIANDIARLTGRQIRVDDADTDLDITIHIVPRSEFPAIIGSSRGRTVDSWSDLTTAGFEIQAATVVVADEATGAFRRHLLREELAQTFGATNASDFEPESIFFRGSSLITEFADIDEFVLRTLYDDRLAPGMEQPEVEVALDW